MSLRADHICVDLNIRIVANEFPKHAANSLVEIIVNVGGTKIFSQVVGSCFCQRLRESEATCMSSAPMVAVDRSEHTSAIPVAGGGASPVTSQPLALTATVAPSDAGSLVVHVDGAGCLEDGNAAVLHSETVDSFAPGFCVSVIYQTMPTPGCGSTTEHGSSWDNTRNSLFGVGTWLSMCTTADDVYESTSLTEFDADVDFLIATGHQLWDQAENASTEIHTDEETLLPSDGDNEL